MRRVFGSFFASNAFVVDARATVRSSSRRSISWRMRRARNSQERTLRERRLGGPKAIENELPAEIYDAHLDRLGVGHAVTGLQQRRHREHRRRHRCSPRARFAVHRFELGLERIIEQLVPMRVQESEQLASSDQARRQELLLSRVRGARLAVHRSHPRLQERADHARCAPRGNLTGFPLASK